MKLSQDQIKEKLGSLPHWKYTNGQIKKTFVLKDFKSAIKFFNQAAQIAEKMNHHPEIDIRYNKVSFSLSTHSEGGVTEKDITLAQKIDGLNL
ncbi:MAG: 4a-hydroxytetrahydrobiopterin dehydratase [Candidatus Doudnabacteria bacterium]|nr:4a-hydroxytetrahydrobiopterin dehydratase [Candidatus Doudnabacteria bacterium]